MSASIPIRVALAGNPNSGKSSVFNKLTGLNQKIGNYPGVTVDKKLAKIKLPSGEPAEIIDLPGTYSIFPKSEDEQVVWDVLTDSSNAAHPDLVVVVADVTNLKRNLLLFTQINDLGIPTVLLLNMIDLADRKKKVVDDKLLAQRLKVPVIRTNARDGSGIAKLFELIEKGVDKPQHRFAVIEPESTQEERRSDVLERYKVIDSIVEGVVRDPGEVIKSNSRTLDRIFTHRILGYLIFLVVLLLVFQAIFKWAEWPMELIDSSFSKLAVYLSTVMPEAWYTDLLTEGVIAGLSGVVIFVPQIAILFFVISILEESGYMARVVFLMDRLMYKVGLNGRSVVPLISGIACAVPAIMASRTIASKKDRLITILVTPLMSCSARLPVYTILIALVIPATTWGIFSLQGIALLFMYFLGFFMAIIAAIVMRLFIKTPEKSYLVMEMPSYRVPRWRNMGLTVYEKTKTFVFEAGKIIMAISILLWIAASYGPKEDMVLAKEQAQLTATEEGLNEKETQNRIAAAKLENSFAGHFGKVIEPAIRPLGYDWKIGIALISSFAAREVFVGTIATIYSVGLDSDEVTVKNRLAMEKNKEGEPMFNFAVGASLLLFYAFAMQCMSTLAIVYRETKGWKWPIIQLVYMSALAYLSAFAAYQAFS